MVIIPKTLAPSSYHLSPKSMTRLARNLSLTRVAILPRGNNWLIPPGYLFFVYGCNINTVQYAR